MRFKNNGLHHKETLRRTNALDNGKQDSIYFNLKDWVKDEFRTTLAFNYLDSINKQKLSYSCHIEHLRAAGVNSLICKGKGWPEKGENMLQKSPY